MSSELITTVKPVVSMTELQINPETWFQPMVPVHVAIERQRQLEQLIGSMLVPSKDGKIDGADYGQIPGTSNKALFQPGAEKLALYFALDVHLYRDSNSIENWEKDFFYYNYRGEVKWQGRHIVDGERSCSTKEKKYAYVWVQTRKTPGDDEAFEMEQLELGKWSVAWKSSNRRPSKADADRLKRNGEGRWFKERGEWVWQEKSGVWWLERRPNPDIASLQFVVQAMAQKRLYVMLVKKALAATGLFSADIDFDEFRAADAGRTDLDPDENNGQASGTKNGKGNSGKLSGNGDGASASAQTATTPKGRQIIALQSALQMDDTALLKMISEECGIEASTVTEAVDAVTEAEQSLLIETLRDRLTGAAARA